jgi:hypothetical protein
MVIVLVYHVLLTVAYKFAIVNEKNAAFCFSFCYHFK